MKIKRYFAPDMRQAINRVREAQGPDAVILSSRKVEGGIELIAAIDYDEEEVHRMASAAEPSGDHAGDAGRRQETHRSAPEGAAAPGDDDDPLGALLTPVMEPPQDAAVESPRGGESGATGRSRRDPMREPALLAMQKEIQGLRGMLQEQLCSLANQEFARAEPWRATIARRLQWIGLEQELSRDIARQVDTPDDPVEGWEEALSAFADRVPVSTDGLLDESGIITLVGPSGVGKTTTVAKLAALYTLRHGQDSVALITTDGNRLGAQRQLQTFGQLLGVPVYAAQTGRQLNDMLERLQSKQMVFIDTAGTSQRDMRMLDELAGMTSIPSARVLLVLAANVQKAALGETLQAFSRLEPDACILTKVDEAASLGEALSALIRAGLPLSFVSEGQRIPDDLRPAQAQRLMHQAAEMVDHRRRERSRVARRDEEQTPAFSIPSTRERIHEPSTRFAHASSH
ncbi:flagellar biosynthesis protein FlhF [Ectothiorhodospira mobilis]|uniref:flagellar biosynthesis protein FlhF n=1 Tax=Ectothiorhodospira mobilis TaxID=195064 RepID=UPI001904EBF1|nr:flagellar biosynthesis protein FlhF [Ectothiorhodospira mobilis]MBK1690704.1 flagellar biosynthesis protein FlhF [Ectothiorhodospira mobilis]